MEGWMDRKKGVREGAHLESSLRKILLITVLR